MNMSISTPERSLAATAAVLAEADAPLRPRSGARLGLAGRLLLLTIGSILLTMAIFYVVRLTSWRETWLLHRLVTAQSAVAALDVTSATPWSHDLAKQMLDAEQIMEISAETRGHRVALVLRDAAATSQTHSDLDNASAIENLGGAIAALLAPDGSTLKVVGTEPTSGLRIEYTVEAGLLTKALWHNTQNFLELSLIVSIAGSLALGAALWHMVIRPVRRLTSSIIAFGANPQDTRRIIEPSGRADDIGLAESALASMQNSLVHELSQRKRLAELGMAVARINHDLRNMLSSAQLISDRLATIDDPSAQRLAPRLVAALDRAIDFCQSTLTYSGASEQAPVRRMFDLRATILEIVETHEASGAANVNFAIDVPPSFDLLADPDQVRRVFENLTRNAVAALADFAEPSSNPAAIRFAAIRASSSEALIEISDSGPGIPSERIDSIFEPFHSTTRNGGSGLGLAIASDLVQRNGGTIRLAPGEPDHFYCGARFLITLPTPQTRHRGPDGRGE